MQHQENEKMMILTRQQNIENSLNITSSSPKKMNFHEIPEGKNAPVIHSNFPVVKPDIRSRFISYFDDRNWNAAVFWGELLLGYSSLYISLFL